MLCLNKSLTRSIPFFQQTLLCEKKKVQKKIDENAPCRTLAVRCTKSSLAQPTNILFTFVHFTFKMDCGKKEGLLVDNSQLKTMLTQPQCICLN